MRRSRGARLSLAPGLVDAHATAPTPQITPIPRLEQTKNQRKGGPQNHRASFDALRLLRMRRSSFWHSQIFLILSKRSEAQRVEGRAMLLHLTENCRDRRRPGAALSWEISPV